MGLSEHPNCVRSCEGAACGSGDRCHEPHLKGAGHPPQTQDERRYMVGAIRYVSQALITSGHGWMDAEPDIARLKPDMVAVNEEGDKPEKRAFCAEHGLAYVVLKRTPQAGLSRRSSIDLRGFQTGRRACR